MKVYVPHGNQSIVLFEPTYGSETTALEKFPALLRSGNLFYCPNKQGLVKHLYHQVRDHITKKIQIDATLSKYLSDPISLDKLPDQFTYHTNPLAHQELALRYAYTFKNVGLLLEPGLGKTKVVCDLIQVLGYRRNLVICPKPLLQVWSKEIDKHRPELSKYIVSSTDWSKEEKHIEGSQVVIINYDKCVYLEPELLKLKFELLAIDEGLISNLNTNRTQSILELGKHAKSKIIMSGTLVNNSPLDLFAPLKFLEPSLLGTSVTRFKSRYTVPAKFNKNVILGFRYTNEIRKALEACCLVMTKSEWLPDLPAKVFHEIEVNLSPAQKQVYEDLSRNWIAILPGESTELEIEIDNPLPLLSKLTQICNGFLYLTKGETTADNDIPGLGAKPNRARMPRKIYEFQDNPKIQKLIELIQPKGRIHGKRAVIWFNMEYEKILLERALTKHRYRFITISGGEKNAVGKVDEFNNDSSIPYLLCQAKTLNYGVTVLGHKNESSYDSDEENDEEILPQFSTEVSDQIFYSLGFSLQLFLQQQDRIHRIGQTKECNYWILQTNSSVERKISRRLQEKLAVNKALLIDFVKSAKIES